MADLDEQIATQDGLSLDALTLVAAAIVAYILQNILHEGVGHGGACLLVGGDPVALSTAYFDHDSQSVSDFGGRFISAAGTLVNLVVGLIFWGLLRKAQTAAPTMRFFLWLSMTVNLLTSTGYLLFSGVLGVGDWVAVADGIQPMWLWRLGISIAGVILYLLCIWIALREMNLLIGGEEPERSTRAFKLSLLPYAAGCVASTIGSVLNPLSSLLIATSAASSFGGTSALAWMTQLLKTKWFPTAPARTLHISRDWGWIATAGVLLVLHIAVLGPSVQF